MRALVHFAFALAVSACGGELAAAPTCTVIAQNSLKDGACDGEATARCELPEGWIQYRVSALRAGEWHHFECEPIAPGEIEDVRSCTAATAAKVALCKR